MNAQVTPADLRLLVSRFYERCWNQWDDSAVEETLSPKIVFRGSLGNETFGRDEWRQYRDMIRAGAPDFHNAIIELVIEPGRAAARLQYSGTHLGPLLEREPTGRRFTYAGTAFFTASDGLLTSIWVLGDLVSLTRQLDEHAGM